MGSEMCIRDRYPTKYCVLEILSNIIYHIEYSSDHTRGSAGCPTSQNMAYLSEMPQMSNSQILSNILYPIEYSYGYPDVSAGYPTFSIAYLIYSTSQSSVSVCLCFDMLLCVQILLGCCKMLTRLFYC